MKYVVAVIVAVLLSACTVVVVNPETDRQVLTAQADARDKALIAKDRAGIEANMAPEFRQIRGAGHIANREEFIKDVLDPAFSIDTYVRRNGKWSVVSVQVTPMPK